MSSSVLLLDPLRSALLMMGISEQFLSVPQVVDLCQTPTYSSWFSAASSACNPFTHPEPRSDHEMTHQIFEIVLDELLAKELSLPLPSDLRAALQLRGDPNIRAFREVFQPWVDRLRSGDLAEEVGLRREVQQAIRAFRNAPRIERLNKILAYVALPVGFIPTIEGVVAGVALGITGIGLSHLAERWQSQSKWLGLTRRAT